MRSLTSLYARLVCSIVNTLAQGHARYQLDQRMKGIRKQFKDRERRTILLDWKGHSKMTNSKAVPLDRQRLLLPHVFGEAVLE